MNQSPNIIDFLKKGYRIYLREKFEFEKSTRRNLTFRFCAAKMKTSAAYLKHVMEERRHISLEKIPSICEVLRLNNFEQKFLTILFLHTQTNEPHMRSYFSEILASLAGGQLTQKDYTAQTRIGENEESTRDYLTALVKALVQFDDFKVDFNWMKKTIREDFSVEEIAQVWQGLVNRGEVQKVGARYKVVSEYHTPSPYDLSSFKVYQTGLAACYRMLEDLKKYISADFFMGALTVSPVAAARLIRLVSKLKAEAVQISENDSGQRCQTLYLSMNLLTVAGPVIPMKAELLKLDESSSS